MSRLFAALVRHGDYHQISGAPSAHQPYALNSDGEGHGKEAGHLLLEFCRTRECQLHPVLDSSRMRRAWQTAHLIRTEAERSGLSGLCIEEFDALAERGVGAVANLTAQQIETIVRDDPRFDSPPPAWKANSRYRLPFQGAESLLEAGERVAAHLRQRIEDSTVTGMDSLKVFVGHGAAFRHAAYHLGLLEFEQIAKLSMYHGRPVFFELNSDGRWRHIAGEWKVRGVASEYKD